MRGRVEPPLEDIAVDDDLAVSLSLFKGGQISIRVAPAATSSTRRSGSTPPRLAPARAQELSSCATAPPRLIPRTTKTPEAHAACISPSSPSISKDEECASAARSSTSTTTRSSSMTALRLLGHECSSRPFSDEPGNSRASRAGRGQSQHRRPSNDGRQTTASCPSLRLG
jgi:hypothetical protein